MDTITAETLAFFNEHPAAFPLYEAFAQKILALHPETDIRIQKTQIGFSNRHLYACVSFQRVRRKAELPDPYLVITLGLSYPLESERVAAKTEPYPGRWTNHIVIGNAADIDEELLGWVQQAYSFAESK